MARCLIKERERQQKCQRVVMWSCCAGGHRWRKSLFLKGQGTKRLLHCRYSNTQRRPSVKSGRKAEEASRVRSGRSPWRPRYSAPSSSQQPCRQELTSPFYGSGNGTWKASKLLRPADIGKKQILRFLSEPSGPFGSFHCSACLTGCDSSQVSGGQEAGRVGFH